MVYKRKFQSKMDDDSGYPLFQETSIWMVQHDITHPKRGALILVWLCVPESLGLNQRRTARKARFGHSPVVNFLLEEGAEVNQCDCQHLNCTKEPRGTGSTDLCPLTMNMMPIFSKRDTK